MRAAARHRAACVATVRRAWRAQGRRHGVVRAVPARCARPVEKSMQFIDRRQAGQLLAEHLTRYRDDRAVIVLALPRGGVPVAFEVATALRAPLDVFIVRKLGLPGHEEFAMGAIASGGVMVMNPDVAGFHVPQAAIDAVAMRERAELDRRERLYR